MSINIGSITFDTEGAYSKIASVIDMPKYEEVKISSYDGTGKVLATGGADRNGYMIKLNGNIEDYAMRNEVDLEIACEEIFAHECVHVHQVFKRVPVKHNAYFKEIACKIGITGKGNIDTEKLQRETGTMKNEIGSINIEELKKAAQAMNMEFDAFLQMTGMTAVIENAEKVQKSEKLAREQEELLKKIEEFESEMKEELSLLEVKMQEWFDSNFDQSDLAKLNFSIKVTLADDGQIATDYTLKMKGAGRKASSRNSSGTRSKWQLKIAGEVKETPDQYLSVWSWLMAELCKAKNMEILPTAFKYALTPSHLARKFMKATTENWKEMVTSGRLEEFCNMHLEEKLGKIEIIEVTGEEE